MSSPRSSAPASPAAQPGARVAAQEGDEVGARRQQGRVDALLAGHLAHPGRHERHGRTQVTVQLLAVRARQLSLAVHPCGHRVEQLLAERAAGVAFVDAARRGQVAQRTWLLLGHAEQRQVGQHLAHRDVAGHRPSFAPGSSTERCHATGPRLPGHGLLLEAQPGGVGVGTADGPGRAAPRRRPPPARCGRRRPASPPSTSCSSSR